MKINKKLLGVAALGSLLYVSMRPSAVGGYDDLAGLDGFFDFFRARQRRPAPAPAPVKTGWGSRTRWSSMRAPVPVKTGWGSRTRWSTIRAPAPIKTGWAGKLAQVKDQGNLNLRVAEAQAQAQLRAETQMAAMEREVAVAQARAAVTTSADDPAIAAETKRLVGLASAAARGSGMSRGIAQMALYNAVKKAAVCIC